MTCSSTTILSSSTTMTSSSTTMTSSTTMAHYWSGPSRNPGRRKPTGAPGLHNRNRREHSLNTFTQVACRRNCVRYSQQPRPSYRRRGLPLGRWIPPRATRPRSTSRDPAAAQRWLEATRSLAPRPPRRGAGGRAPPAEARPLPCRDAPAGARRLRAGDLAARLSRRRRMQKARPDHVPAAPCRADLTPGPHAR